MIRLPAAIACCTASGAPAGIAAVPLGRILATAPDTVGPLGGAQPPDATGVVVAAASGPDAAGEPAGWLCVYCATSRVTSPISGGYGFHAHSAACQSRGAPQRASSAAAAYTASTSL